MKNKQIIGIVVAGIVFIMVCATGILTNALSEKLKAGSTAQKDSIEMWSSLMGMGSKNIELPTKDFIGVIDVVGTIQASSSTSSFTSSGEYDHDLYMKYIDQLEQSNYNKGILLYVNSPGGTVYESDELYLRLMQYKENTERPIYAYFADQACSGGYYVSMAADKIYANRNGWTGSIGVIISLTNCKELYKKLGIKEIDITSGKNKAMGSAGIDLTKEQEDILQGLVDEAYEQFTDIVSKGRGLDIGTVKKLADGRIYSAKQAMENGLVDASGSLEDLKTVIQEENGLSDSVVYHQANSGQNNIWSALMGYAKQLKPQSDVELVKDIMENKGNGVLMYYAD